MSTPSTSQQFRERARALRALAGRLDRLGLHDLHHAADRGTWQGPSPQACFDAIDGASRRLRAAADELRHVARRFERRADEIEAEPARRVMY